MRFGLSTLVLCFLSCITLASCSGGAGGNMPIEDPGIDGGDDTMDPAGDGSTGGDDAGDGGAGDDGGTDSGGGTGGDGGGSTGGGDTGGDTGGGSGGDTGSGGGTNPDPVPPVPTLNIATAAERAFFEGEFAAGFASVRDSAQNGGVSMLADLPATGLSAYEGYMEILFFSSPAANVRGEAALTVDLQTGATNGGVTGFMGFVLDDDMINQIVNYEGDITISGGSLTAEGIGAAGLNMSVDGALDNGRQSFNVTGELNGYLFGPTGEGMVASGRSNALNDDIITTVDGTEVDGSITMWALQN